MCPVVSLRWLREFYVRQGEAQLACPVFRRAAHLGVLSKTTVSVRLHKWLQWVGVKSWSLYAAHSLRRGGATWAVRQGVSVRQVQVMGRWKSDVVRKYLYCSASAMYGASSRQQRG